MTTMRQIARANSPFLPILCQIGFGGVEREIGKEFNALGRFLTPPDVCHSGYLPTHGGRRRESWIVSHAVV